jgi:hypothetical protein
MLSKNFQNYIYSSQLVNNICSVFRRPNVKRFLKKAYGCLSIVRHGFWFVDIPRTSSSSLRSEFGKHFGRVYGKKNLIEKEHATSQIFVDHIPAREMRSLLGNSIWKRIFTFTIVRNPWDRTHSMYNYRQKVFGIPREWSFRDYVFALEGASCESEFFEYHGYRYGASEYVLGDNGEIIVDFIARYENRSHDLKMIASRLKLDDFGGLCIQMATPKDKHYSEIYDVETREIIRRLYAKDIDLFGYEFYDKT